MNPAGIGCRARWMLGAIMAFGMAGVAQAPQWWMNRAVLDTNAPPNDFAVANQGQAKWFALQAREVFDSTVPGGAGAAVDALVAGFSGTNNFLPLNVGQLKILADPFYSRLVEMGWTNAFPTGVTGLRPWTETTADDNDYAIVNLGQLKHVFGFDPEAFLILDSDGDGMPDWWELAHGLDPYAAGDGGGDLDGDGFTNAEEYLLGMNPTKGVVSGAGAGVGFEVFTAMTN